MLRLRCGGNEVCAKVLRRSYPRPKDYVGHPKMVAGQVAISRDTAHLNNEFVVLQKRLQQFGKEITRR